jgi:DNA invertase Pin-like site-specific DNA recombinase
MGPPRQAGDTTHEGQRWFAKLTRAQRDVERAEQRRDELVKEALATGVGVRGVAKALGIDKATVSRRYGAKGRD